MKGIGAIRPSDIHNFGTAKWYASESHSVVGARTPNSAKTNNKDATIMAKKLMPSGLVMRNGGRGLSAVTVPAVSKITAIQGANATPPRCPRRNTSVPTMPIPSSAPSPQISAGSRCFAFKCSRVPTAHPASTHSSPIRITPATVVSIR